MNIVVVIPTYNEAENVARLIPVLEDEFAQHSNHTFNVLFVDGNSSDKTSEIIKSAETTNPNVFLLQEEKKSGLGSAYIKAFKYALQKFQPDVLVEMDADLQHDPKDVVRLVNEIENGSDYVIGSRFTKGGSIPQNWAFYRKFLSVGGNIFTRVVLNIYNIHDFTSGFKASRVKGFVDQINLDQVLSGGFAYKIDLLFRMRKLGAKFKEVPIVFGLRDRGDSKMEKNNVLDSLKVVLLIRFRESQSFLKFLVVGFTGLFVDAATFNISRTVLANSTTASMFSGTLGILTTFILNNYWSFNHKKIHGFSKKLTSFIKYFVTSLIPILVRTKLISWAVFKLGDTFIISNAAFFIGIVFGLVWNYTIYSKIIWRSGSPQNSAAKKL